MHRENYLGLLLLQFLSGFVHVGADEMLPGPQVLTGQTDVSLPVKGEVPVQWVL